MVGWIYCPKEFTYWFDRMFAHLGHKAPTIAQTNVTLCRILPPRIKQLFKNCDGMIPIHLGNAAQLFNEMELYKEDHESILSHFVNMYASIGRKAM